MNYAADRVSIDGALQLLYIKWQGIQAGARIPLPGVLGGLLPYRINGSTMPAARSGEVSEPTSLSSSVRFRAALRSLMRALCDTTQLGTFSSTIR